MDNFISAGVMVLVSWGIEGEERYGEKQYQSIYLLKNRQIFAHLFLISTDGIHGQKCRFGSSDEQFHCGRYDCFRELVNEREERDGENQYINSPVERLSTFYSPVP